MRTGEVELECPSCAQKLWYDCTESGPGSWFDDEFECGFCDAALEVHYTYIVDAMVIRRRPENEPAEEPT